MPMVGLDLTLRTLRILHGVFLLTLLLYGYAAHVVARTDPKPVAPAMFSAIAIISVVMLLCSAAARSKMITPAVERLREVPDDSVALGNWRKGVILADVFNECVALFGFALWMLGADVKYVAAFFVVPVVVLLLTFPKRP